jgi:hypothetical protein
MIVKEFDKLIKRDFQNGAVLDEIRKSLKELEKLKKENILLHDKMNELQISYNLITEGIRD